MLVIEAATAIAPRTVLTVDFCSPAMMIEPDDGDRRDRVGQRHQRRVQQARDVLDDLEADERRQHEHEQHRPQVEFGHMAGEFSTVAVGADGTAVEPKSF